MPWFPTIGPPNAKFTIWAPPVQTSCRRTAGMRRRAGWPSAAATAAMNHSGKRNCAVWTSEAVSTPPRASSTAAVMVEPIPAPAPAGGGDRDHEDRGQRDCTDHSQLRRRLQPAAGRDVEVEVGRVGVLVAVVLVEQRERPRAKSEDRVLAGHPQRCLPELVALDELGLGVPLRVADRLTCRVRQEREHERDTRRDQHRAAPRHSGARACRRATATTNMTASAMIAGMDWVPTRATRTVANAAQTHHSGSLVRVRTVPSSGTAATRKNARSSGPANGPATRCGSSTRAVTIPHDRGEHARPHVDRGPPDAAPADPTGSRRAPAG